MTSQKCIIVDSLTACRSAVRDLEREHVVAIDAEGINLSLTGPLTLLQIGTPSQNVYLFDVQSERQMFEHGGLKAFLAKESIVKVMHSSKNDAGALYEQFGVSIQGVFDVQVAQMELDRKLLGRRLPTRLKLVEVVAKYCEEKAAMLADDKDAIQSKWNKTDGEYWGKRPLTPEMIQYACKDVTVLIPEVYSEQKQLLKQHGLWERFLTCVEKDIEAKHNKELMDLLNKESEEVTIQVLRDFAESASPQINFSDITDEDVLAAFNQMRIKNDVWKDLPPLIWTVRIQFLRAKLEELEQELSEKGEDFEPKSYMFSLLSACISSSEDENLQAAAKRVQGRIEEDIVIKDISVKYKMTTPLKHLANYEKRALTFRLRPDGEQDPKVPRVALRLYWLAKQDDLEGMVKRYEEQGRDFHVNEGYAKFLRYCISGNVPASMKRIARPFLDSLEANGIVSRPASRRTPQGRGRRY